MNSIMTALIAALAFVTNSRVSTAALRKQVSDLTANNAQLHTALDAAVAAQKAPDPELLQQISDLKADRDRIQTEHAQTLADIQTATDKAAELATSISEDPSIPITQDPVTGSVTLPATPPPAAPVIPEPADPVGTAPARTLTFLSGENKGGTIAIPADVAADFDKHTETSFPYTTPDGLPFQVTRTEDGNYTADVIEAASSSSSSPSPAPAVPPADELGLGDGSSSSSAPETLAATMPAGTVVPDAKAEDPSSSSAPAPMV